METFDMMMETFLKCSEYYYGKTMNYNKLYIIHQYK